MFPNHCNPTQSHSPQPSALRTGSVRRGAVTAVALATLAGFIGLPQTATAQQAESSSRPGHHIAVIDIAYIFKNLPSIKSEVEKVESELKAFDTEVKQRRQALQQAVAQLKTLKVGTPDYAKQEEAVATMESKMRLDMGRKQKEFGEAEAKIYFTNYQRISAAVKAIATHNKINLVLRFNSEGMDMEKSETVARGVMKNIVYHDSTIDMTEMVMRYLEQTAATPVARGTNSAAKR